MPPFPKTATPSTNKQTVTNGISNNIQIKSVFPSRKFLVSRIESLGRDRAFASAFSDTALSKQGFPKEKSVCETKRLHREGDVTKSAGKAQVSKHAKSAASSVLTVQSTTDHETGAITTTKETIPVPLITPKDCDGPWKTLLVMGESSSGNAEAVDAMVNFLMGVQDNDAFRYSLVVPDESDGNTAMKDVVAFNFYPVHPDISYGITLIRTPGFGSPASPDGVDVLVWQRIRDFLEDYPSKLAAVCLSVSTGNPFTMDQWYTHQMVSELLGEEATGKVFTTVSDVGKEGSLSPSVMHNEDGPDIKLNKSTLRRPTGKTSGMANGYDTGGSKCCPDNSVLMPVLVNALRDEPLPSSPSPSSTSSESNHPLENVVMSINRQIRTGLDTLECIWQTVQYLKEHENEVTSDPAFKMIVPKPKLRKIAPVNGKTRFTLCLVCNSEYNPTHGRGACPICPLENIKEVSYLLEHTIEWAEETQAVTAETMERSIGGHSRVELILLDQRAKYVATKEQILADIETVRSAIECIQSKGRRHKVFHADEHFGHLIGSEIKRQEPGFHSRVQFLCTLGEQARYLRQAEKAQVPEKCFQTKDPTLVQIDEELERIASEKSRKVAVEEDCNGSIARLLEKLRSVTFC